LFQQKKLRPRPERLESKSRPRVNHKKSDNDNSAKQLEESIKQYQVDLLSSIGESEEYMRLYVAFPKMKTHLETQYHQARERSSKLLGQIKAIKNILSHHQILNQCD